MGRTPFSNVNIIHVHSMIPDLAEKIVFINLNPNRLEQELQSENERQQT